MFGNGVRPKKSQRIANAAAAAGMSEVQFLRNALATHRTAAALSLALKVELPVVINTLYRLGFRYDTKKRRWNYVPFRIVVRDPESAA